MAALVHSRSTRALRQVNALDNITKRDGPFTSRAITISKEAGAGPRLRGRAYWRFRSRQLCIRLPPWLRELSGLMAQPAGIHLGVRIAQGQAPEKGRASARPS